MALAFLAGRVGDGELLLGVSWKVERALGRLLVLVVPPQISLQGPPEGSEFVAHECDQPTLAATARGTGEGLGRALRME